MIKTKRPTLLAICRDPEVMRYIGPQRSEDEIRAAIQRQEAQKTAHGHCYRTLKHRADRKLIGDPLRRHFQYRIARPVAA